jgi:hypothetical protein
MYSGKLALTNRRGTPYALSNEFSDQYLFSEAVQDCQSTQELLNTANSYQLYNYRLRIDNDNAKYTRLAFTDGFGNEYYLIAYKDTTSNKLSNISDEELIAELERRGYTI